MLIRARSIGRRAAWRLPPGAAGHVLASFAHVCDLVTDAGKVVALVWGGIGNGPLNLVLEHGPDPVPEAGTRFAVVSAPPGQTLLRIGGPSPVEIALSTAAAWEPRPDWDLLRARRLRVAAGAAISAGILAEEGWSPARCGLPEALCEQAARGQPAALRDLVGLGPGLTPAGDDWLAGWLLAQHLAPDPTRSRPRSRASLVLAIAADRTTTLSRAFLDCAAAGETDAAWQALFSALATDSVTNLTIYQSTVAILSHGASSGAAMLTGFTQSLRCLTPVS